MRFFSRTLSPLYLGAPQPLHPERLESLAHCVGISTGLGMLTAQAANSVLRHCRIGIVTPKLKANA